MSKDRTTTAKELAAIEAVKAAVKALPRGIYIRIPHDEGTLEFWKRDGPGSAFGAAEPLVCKRALSL